MGFLNKILRGLGFEDEDQNQTKEIKVKEKNKNKNKNNNNISAKFDLNEYSEEASSKPEINEEEPAGEEKQETKDVSFQVEVVKVKSQQDAQSVVSKLKTGARVLVNLEQMSEQDITRSLDFITGGCFALNLKMQKIDDKIFLIQ